jgi:hypothetical protein
MKNLIFTAVVFTGICSSKTISAQHLTDAQIASKINAISLVFKQYQKDMDDNSKKKQDQRKKEKQLNKLAYNPKMMNVFVANNIGNYLSGSKDISLQKSYAVIDQSETSLFVGYNLLFKPTRLETLEHIATIGIKTDLSENFTSLLKNGNINPEMGLNFKYTYFWRSRMNATKEQRAAIDSYRKNYLVSKYKAVLAKYATVNATAYNDANTELEAKLKYTGALLSDKEKASMIDKELEDQYEKIAVDEEKFIVDNKVFNSITKTRFAWEIYLPAKRKEYKFSPATTTFATTDEYFYNFKTNILLGRMQKWRSKRTLFTIAQLSGYNLNNVITEDVSGYKFETIASQGGNNQTVIDTKDAYVGELKQGFATSIKGEAVFFFWKDLIGISAAAEMVMGKFSARNWKIGLPFSLKDKDDKPSINLEFQFKEVYKTHSLGIAVGYSFGKYFD